MEDTSNFVPIAEQGELRLLIKDQDRVIQALQEGMANHAAARANQDQVIQALQEGMATQAKEIAMLTAAIQENHEAHEEAVSPNPCCYNCHDQKEAELGKEL